MSDDWAKKYVESYNQEQQEKQRKEQEARMMLRLAEDGAHKKFHQIRECIERDIHTLRGAAVFQSVELDKSVGGKLTVIHRGTPRVELHVDLNATTLSCEYTFPTKGGAKETQAKRESKTLLICSDLDSNITVQEKREGKTFVDESEVSEFLLMPLLDYINSQ
jgi:hypothetical protein